MQACSMSAFVIGLGWNVQLDKDLRLRRYLERGRTHLQAMARSRQYDVSMAVNTGRTGSGNLQDLNQVGWHP